MSDSRSSGPPPPRFSLRARLTGLAVLFLAGLALGIYLEYGIVMSQLDPRCPHVWRRVPALSGRGDPGQGIVPPHVVEHPLDYNWGELLIGMHGDAVLEVFVQPDGTVGQARLVRSSGYCPLDASALAGVVRWRYQPATRQGIPFGTWWLTSVAFRMNPPMPPAPPPPGQQTLNAPLHR